ncbi:3-hydroxyisobutyryl-CoA hydrolase [Arthrobacter sp. MYb227]|uniref:enoyl-CoA hydratase/isomerase family protein n=1 Tax=Arthrobacter sp. MYb227 TaxID=1848601 RepID=UPI000CFAC1F4|nr:enoyl-CoA hydratase/isomerase family protein [Arthrobacter sp. MYb227]PQZ89060.1 3-hydroxyisobutyryl-CoA hydrolase [Arthrobacter sp. MYb227]
MSESEILFEVRGTLGLVTLNRPRAVNALTGSMVDAMLQTLTTWASDPAIAQVLVHGAGDRGLCAGGDIVAIHRDISAGGRQTADFWDTEYRLNALINSYPKPYIAYMDGLVLGGGVGISAHGSHRIVTERTRSGMPETTLGFCPDVGGTYLLSRSPGHSGIHAALTGDHLGGAEAIYLGLADYLVDSARFPQLLERLQDHPVEQVLPRFVLPQPVANLETWAEWIDVAYARPTVLEIIATLHEFGLSGNGQAQKTIETLAKKSPTALAVTLESLHRAGNLESLEAVLEQEYRVGLRFLESDDFPEGIRAQVIDKDYAPVWNPATLHDVTPESVAAFFAPLGEHELRLTPSSSVTQTIES